jgi:hypothetical protein
MMAGRVIQDRNEGRRDEANQQEPGQPAAGRSSRAAELHDLAALSGRAMPAARRI